MLSAPGISSSMLLALPQGAGKPAQPLPFPNGSLISARILQTDQGMASMQLGSMRLQIKLPAQLPAGNLWVLVLDNSVPAKLRIMSESQAAAILAGRLAEAAGAEQKQGKPLQQEWPFKQQQSQQHHYSFHPSADQNKLHIDDGHDGSPRGMLERDSDEDGFSLHGRLDLETLGTIHFALRKQAEEVIQLQVRAADHDSFMQLQQPFESWLQENDNFTGISGLLSEGAEPIVKPNRSTGRHA